MEASARHAPVRLDGDTRCQSCGERLAAGDVAAIDAISNTIVCFACATNRPEGEAGASAQREYERRRQRRHDHARETLGLVGTVLAHVIEEPQSTGSWSQGARGHSILKIGGRDQTKLIDGVERQVKLVAAALARAGFGDLDVRGALCFPDPEGLPLRQLSVRGIVIDGPKPIAKLARRAGPLYADQVDQLAHQLAALSSRPPDRRRSRHGAPVRP
jgi:hypothetical protein